MAGTSPAMTGRNAVAIPPTTPDDRVANAARLQKTADAENSRGRAKLWSEGLHALCARTRARPGSAQCRRTCLRLREASEGAADLCADAGLFGLLAAPPRSK